MGSRMCWEDSVRSLLAKRAAASLRSRLARAGDYAAASEAGRDLIVAKLAQGIDRSLKIETAPACSR